VTAEEFATKLRRRLRVVALALRGRAIPLTNPGEPVSAGSEWGAEHDSAAYVQRRDVEDFHSMRRLLAFTLAPGDSCIDIGAHRGLILSEILRVAPEGQHLAFEPIPALARGLREQFPGVTVHELALSDHPGSAEFTHVLGEAEGWSGLKFRPLPAEVDAPVEQINVTLARLDDLIGPDMAPALIKIDVEGAELEVLGGARETLRRHAPIIVFEHGSGSAEAYGTHPRDVFALLGNELGYRIFDLDGNGPYTLSELEHGFYERIRVNWVAVPARSRVPPAPSKSSIPAGDVR
jgi:FkbM family methyltransferase